MDDGRTHQIIECEIRLHRAAPAGVDPLAADAAAWAATAVGPPAAFRALADPTAGQWNGPLSPGVDVAPPAALADGWWTVRLAGSTGVPILADRVGRPLEAGEAFRLAPGEPSGWRAQIAFDGHIIEA